jgi:polysaccharide biosynthesis/export protein
MRNIFSANSSYRVPVLPFLLFCLITVPVCAQTAKSSATQPAIQMQNPAILDQDLQPGRTRLADVVTDSQDRDSLIGPADLLNVSVFEAPEMSSTVRVTAGGEISLQLLGAVHAAGLTPRELESVLQELLRRTFIKDPHVGVFVQELQSHAVSVVGAVKMPGVFQMHGSKTLLEVLSMAQGLADDAGDSVLIMRGTRSGESPNSNPAKSATAARAILSPPAEVFPPGYGVTAPASEATSKIEQIDLRALLTSSDPALNVPIHPGDIVKVQLAGIVYVVGEVTKPGGFVLQRNENISVLQALALAQGSTHTSAMSRARIIRTDPFTGNRTEIPTDLSKVLAGKAPDTLLQSRDVVFVPNSTTKSVLYRTSAAALQTAAGVAIYKW